MKVFETAIWIKNGKVKRTYKELLTNATDFPLIIECITVRYTTPNSVHST